MYTDTITLFNRKEGNEGDTWYPVVLKNVHVNVDRAAIMAKYGAESADSAIINIRYVPDGNNKLINGRRWFPPKEWDNLTDQSGTLTFTTGDRFDFIWVGDWGNEDPVKDSDYIADLDFYTYMNRTHDYVFAVASVAMYSVIPHFEIMGK